MSEKQAEIEKATQEFERLESREIAENYRIVGRQGAGGCSVVYDAWSIADGRHVAIKVLALPEGLEYSEAELTKKRFFREARILSTLKNEHSVECLEYGLFNGAPCVVLEFVDGAQLDTFLREYGALPFEYGVGIICQVLEALEEAHSKGIIHRDIKPANILVLQNSEPPVVRLIDFGIATLQEGALGELMRTRLGVVRGTPSYMAPELFTGQTSASPESDIYAIGLVLCEILTGSVCVSGASLMQIAYKQAHEELVIPELIPDCLAQIIRKCCAKQAADRYHSARDLINDLQANLQEACEKRAACEAAYLKSIKDGTHGKKKKGLPIALLIVLGVIIVGLVGLLGFTHYQQAKDEAAAQAAAEAEAERVAQEAAKAEAERAAQEAANAEAMKKATEEAAAKAVAEANAKAKAEIEAAKAANAEAIAAAEEAAKAAKAEAEAAKEKAEAAKAAKSGSSTKKTEKNTESKSSSKSSKKSTSNAIPVGLF